MKHSFTSILILILAMMTLMPVSAQESGDLYFVSEGDLWAWNPQMSEPEQLTEWGYNGGPVLSPDGSQIAYVSVANEAVARGTDPQSEDGYLVYAPTPVNNIWVMDTANRDFTRIADQGDAFPTLRGVPVWSPSGDELAWIEYGVSENDYNVRSRLKVYNFASDSIRDVAFVNLGFQDAGLRLPSLQWGSAGISYMIFTYVETGGAQMQLYVIDPSNGNVNQFVLYAAGDNPFAPGDITPESYVWVEHNGQSMIAMIYSDGNWRLLDPVSGTQTQLADAPYLVQNNGIIGLLAIDYILGDERFRDIRWTAQAPNRNSYELYRENERLSRNIPALSPSGNAMVYVEGNAYRYERIDGTESRTIYTGPAAVGFFNSNIEPPNIVWTPMRWVTSGIVGDPIATPVASNPNTGTTACDLPIPFALGDFVTVQAGPPNNLRSDPTVTGAFTGSLYSGDLVSVTDGPICADGFRWWFITGGGGFGGWTAEGASDGSEQWLIRLLQSPLVNECPLAPRLTVGATGVVLPGEPNVLRDGPDATATTVIGQIPAEGQFTVLGTSLCGMDGRRWYPVDYDGDLGWTAEGEGSTYWLAPVN